MGMFRIVVLIAGVSAAGASLAADKVLTAANGAALRAPEIDHLSCSEMQGLLTEYADSGYRSTGPVQAGHPDRAIFDYENKLAEVHYQDCQSGSAYFENSAPVFGQGFK